MYTQHAMVISLHRPKSENVVQASNALKEDKPPNKRQAESTHVYTLYRKSPLKEDNLSIRDKTAGPEGVL